MNEVECWIWLQQVFGPGNPVPAGLTKAFGSAEGIFRASREDYRGVAGLTGRELDRLCDKSLQKAKKITADCLRLGYTILCPADEGYPARLRQIYAPPCVLYVQGALRQADETLPIAMVGTRRISEYGFEAATRLAIGLVACGAVIVSGLAIGVDAAAHKGALKGGGRTVAVIGCGLDFDYPASNRELRRLIAANGAVVSEYPPGYRPTAFTFPVRNRIIAGLSLGTVVVEAGAKSGSLITAGLAAEMGRDVFTVPGNIFSPGSEGTNKLLRDGAKPVMGVTDILEEYIAVDPQSIRTEFETAAENGPMPEAPLQMSFSGVGGCAQKKPERKQPVGLTQAQAAVYAQLSDIPVHVDELSLRANLEPRVVLGALTTLEIQGFARSLPGRCFARA